MTDTTSTEPRESVWPRWWQHAKGGPKDATHPDATFDAAAGWRCASCGALEAMPGREGTA